MDRLLLRIDKYLYNFQQLRKSKYSQNIELYK